MSNLRNIAAKIENTGHEMTATEVRATALSLIKGKNALDGSEVATLLEGAIDNVLAGLIKGHTLGAQAELDRCARLARLAE